MEKHTARIVDHPPVRSRWRNGEDNELMDRYCDLDIFVDATTKIEEIILKDSVS